jgi:tRNA G18 (ribose-2'-O)-methylase SpoU
MNRENTRRERYDMKLANAIVMPAAIVAVNFDSDDNIAFLIRSAVCFGIADLFVIGRLPERSSLNSKSGSLYDYINIKSFKTPSDFLRFAEESGYKVVACELTDGANVLHEYSFDFDTKTALVVGHETHGVPSELLFRNDIVYIPMLGPGYCLNTSQAGTAVMQEYARQYYVKASASKRDKVSNRIPRMSEQTASEIGWIDIGE